MTESGPPDPEFFTVRELADLLRLKERKVYDLAASGAVPCASIGRSASTIATSVSSTAAASSSKLNVRRSPASV